MRYSHIEEHDNMTALGVYGIAKQHVGKSDEVVMKGEVRGYSDECDIVVVKQSKVATVNGKKP